MGQAPVDKRLIEVSDGVFAEAIFFNRPEKRVVCFSTQLTCSVGCKFCASPGPEKTVNLSADEMMKQIDSMLGENQTAKTDNIILFSFMGEGEPFLNYKNVIEVMHRLEDRFGTNANWPYRLLELHRIKLEPCRTKHFQFR